MLRRRLRTELRAARLKRDLTQDQVAKAMDWSLSKMNRIEKAKTGISTNDLKALLPFYGITDSSQTEELLDLARAARQPGWWRHYSDVAPPALLELIDYESAASGVRQFETTFVPGILQTEEYASAVLQVLYDEESVSEKVAILVDLRTRRRGLLTSQNAPNFVFVLDESVIVRLVGSQSATSQQLEHLVNMAKLPNVTIQIVPFRAGLHPGMKGPFEVVEFDDTPDENIVFVEEQNGNFISDEPKQTGSYIEAFRRIREKSLSPSDSISRLLETAGEMA
ncbi:MAG TPA: helix-turn-helix transcriptional regulator [Streptosporangiaceae bacterium]|nr:helix-turn-helix transcriptional regulator [Streptosporangiaceae bacterium]